MAKKNIFALIGILVLLLVILAFSVNIGTSNAFSCSNQNITLTNSSSFVCTDQWVNVLNPTSIVNGSIIAKGIFISNTFSITGNSTLNVSKIINNGKAVINSTLLSGSLFENYGTVTLQRPVFLNFTYFFNKGSVINENYLDNGGHANSYLSYDNENYGCGGESFSDSFAGSGGASISYSACDGGSTLVSGGAEDSIGDEGYPTYYWNTSGKHVYSAPSNYSFNLSLLSSAGGASYNGASSDYLIRGGSGVLPLIIITKYFDNKGKISNEGQSINYSKIKNASLYLSQGIIGSGGGGTLQIISKYFIDNGSLNVSGGRVYFNTSIQLPYHYTPSDFGYGGEGNVFFFRAGSGLLSNSIKNYNWNSSQESFGVSDSNSSSGNAVAYNVNIAFPAIAGCNYNGVYLKVNGVFNNASFSRVQPVNDTAFALNSSVKNISFSMSGSNLISQYYNTAFVSNSGISNGTTVKLGLKNSLPVVISFGNGKNLSFSLKENGSLLSSGTASANYTFDLPQGNYSLSISNSSENNTYNIMVQRNCLGYQNIAIPAGKGYYTYDSLKIPVNPLLVYKTNQTEVQVVKYRNIDSCGFNASQLLDLDNLILHSISEMNNTVSAYGKANYTGIVEKEVNYTNYMLSAYSSKAKTAGNISLNQSGLNLLDYSSSGNLTKEVFQLSGNGTINLSYGNGRKIQILVSRQNTQNILVSAGDDVMRAFAYVPSLFMGFLGGL